MVFQVHWLELPWIATLLACSLIPLAAPSYVNCNLGNELEGSCSCKKVGVAETPWPDAHERAAPAPRNATIEMDYTDGKLFPKIGWTIEKKDASAFKGFYVEIVVWPNWNLFYHCTHNMSTILKNHQEDLIAYTLEGCCRSLYDGFMKGNMLNLAVFSLPLYGVNDELNSARAFLTVEDAEVYRRRMKDLKVLHKIRKKVIRKAEYTSTRLSGANPENALLESSSELDIWKKVG